MQKKLFLKKSFLIIAAFSVAILTLEAQPVTIENCQLKARDNYPLMKQFGLIEKTNEYNISNANKAWLPQVNFTAKATYQSEVTKLPITIPNVTIPSLTRDQYNAALDVSQTIWDGGVVNAQKKAIKAQTEAEKQKLEVDLYALKERINQLFFGILLLNEQLTQLTLVKTELQTNIERVTALKQNGIANQIDLDLIHVEQINLIQKENDLIATRKSFIDLLETFTKLNLSEKSEFIKPTYNNFLVLTENKRPELLLLQSQSNALDSQRDMIKASNLPKLGLFAQGGYGKPGLNMLTNAFNPYYIGGLRLSWNLSGFYTQKNNMDKITESQKAIEIQKETFLFNNKMQNKQQVNEIEKLKTALKNDDEIISLRKNIKKATSAKVENGTATVTDFLRELNAESAANQTRSLHEIQLLIAIYQLKNQTNNN